MGGGASSCRCPCATRRRNEAAHAALRAPVARLAPFHAALRAAEAVPFCKDLQIPRGAWEAMGPLAQATAAAAGAQRAALSRLPLLRMLGETLPAAEATGAGVTVLQKGAGDTVSVGLFELPKLDDAVQGPPKSE